MKKTYYPTGVLEFEGHVSYNIPDGAYNRYFEDGTLKESGTYLNGRVNGKLTVYYPNGAVKLEQIYREGKLISAMNYDEDGNLVPGAGGL